MSGVIKGVGKTFKKVLKTAVKIAPYAVLAGAVIFTGGAALGITGTWAAASASVGSIFGSTLGPIVTGAVFQAGIGAAVGGGVAALTGGNIGKGITKGALVGAATGAATGLLAPGMVPSQTLAQANAAPAAAAPAPITSPTVGENGVGLMKPATPAAPAVAGATPAPISTNAPPPSAPPPAGRGTGLLAFADAHPGAAGAALQGVGTALSAFGGEGAGEAQRVDAEEKRVNYGTSADYTGLLRRQDAQTDVRARPRPEERFSYDYEFVWDPNARRLVKQQTGMTAQPA